MKPIQRVTLLGLLAVLAAVAFTTASASAACLSKSGSKKFELCVNKAALTEATTVETTGKLIGNLTLTLPHNWESSIVCSGLTGSPKFGVSGLTESTTAGLSVLIHGCVLQGPLAEEDGCRVPTERKFESLTGSFASLENIGFTPIGGSRLFSFAFSGASCPIRLAGEHEVSGSYECKLQHPSIEAVEHELKCTTSTTHKLKTEGSEDSLTYNETIALGGSRAGDTFSVYEAE